MSERCVVAFPGACNGATVVRPALLEGGRSATPDNRPKQASHRNRSPCNLQLGRSFAGRHSYRLLRASLAPLPSTWPRLPSRKAYRIERLNRVVIARLPSAPSARPCALQIPVAPSHVADLHLRRASLPQRNLASAAVVVDVGKKARFE